jgi:Domain of unknown function (DUF4386)
VTRTANARLAGFTFLVYIGVGISSLILSGRAMRGEGIAAKLASVAQHQTEVRVVALLALLMAFSAIVLGVTLYAITRDEDPDIAMLALICRVVEGVNNASAVRGSLGLLWLSTATGADAPDPEAARALGALLLNEPGGSALFFAVGSTLFSWLLLRGRMIPIALAWLGVLGSLALVIILPLQLSGLLSGTNWFGAATWLMWLPMLVFEIALAFWLIVKGVAAPSRPRSA